MKRRSSTDMSRLRKVPCTPELPSLNLTLENSYPYNIYQTTIDHSTYIKSSAKCLVFTLINFFSIDMYSSS